MEQVKELFSDCADVFEELLAVRKHLEEKMEACRSAVESIHRSVGRVDASHAAFGEQIQVHTHTHTHTHTYNDSYECGGL